ncbi:hypothetical protein AAA315_14775 [Ruthenibacterium lactatiformans]|jgi:predicted  nucleic acid-binding Zn-ribbon protein|uniref:hypothetical protein n=1 Tax=Ruthenibacterium lactatiformans TaxID=1550024 RepID=UPI0032BF2E7F
MAGFHFYAGATRTILRGEAQCWKTKVFFVEDNMENCPQHEALEFRVKQAEKKIELIDHQLTNLDKNEAVFNQRIADALENLSALPNAIDRLNKSTTEMKFSMEKMQNELTKNTQKVDRLENKLEAIEEKGKFDIWGWIKSNWLLIGTSLLVIVAVIGELIKNIIR